jgi:multidrug resistance protein, MATE family
MTSKLTHLSVLRIAVPIVLSNVSEPMIGVVNTAVMGRLPSPHYIGAIVEGSLIFAFLFWGFGFLRLSTSGLAAQATGARDTDGLVLVFWRSVALALVIGMVLLALGPLIGSLAVALVGGSDDVMREALVYFSYRVLSAPAALANFAILGWLIGQGRATAAFVTQLFLNLVNMWLSALFVLHFAMATQGVGFAVVIAEYAAVGFGLMIALPSLRRMALAQVFQRDKMLALIGANADIMIRTFCLVFAFGWFISRGAKAGDLVMAANAVLMNLFEVAAYMIDGFAYAAEALTGQAIGARDHTRFRRAVKLTTVWAVVLGSLCSLIIWFAGPWLIGLLTTNAQIKQTAITYLPWAALTPLLGTICFQFDGIFTGAMATREMRNMMALSLLVYLIATAWLEPRFGNHGLWAGLCIFFVTRGLTFAWQMPAIMRRVLSTSQEAGD